MPSDEVKIDWTPATDDQLSELYDALYERNALLAKTLDSLHFRVNLGTRLEEVSQFKDSMLAPSKALADSILKEVSRRRRVTMMSPEETAALAAATHEV